MHHNRSLLPNVEVLLGVMVKTSTCSNKLLDTVINFYWSVIPARTGSVVILGHFFDGPDSSTKFRWKRTKIKGAYTSVLTQARNGRTILIEKILFLQLLHGFKLFHLVSDFQNSFCFWCTTLPSAVRKIFPFPSYWAFSGAQPSFWPFQASP